MSVGIDGGPAGFYSPPPDDAEPMTLAEYLRGALALIAQDRALTPDEMQEIQLFMAGVQEIGQQRAAAAAPQVAPGQGMFNPGTEEDASQQPGAEPAQPMLAGEEPA